VSENWLLSGSTDGGYVRHLHTTLALHCESATLWACVVRARRGVDYYPDPLRPCIIQSCRLSKIVNRSIHSFIHQLEIKQPCTRLHAANRGLLLITDMCAQGGQTG
jgi:hypothetical protein